MEDNNKKLLDRLDFIEFKQNIIFLKPPHHNAQIFYQLSLEDFLKIREFTKSYITKIENNEEVSFNDFEKKIIDIWQPAKSYPLSASLICKVLMGNSSYNKLIS